MQVLRLILQGKQLGPVSSCPPEVREIMERCWSPDPSSRPTFQDIESSLRNIENNITQSSDLVTEICETFVENFDDSDNKETFSKVFDNSENSLNFEETFVKNWDSSVRRSLSEIFEESSPGSGVNANLTEMFPEICDQSGPESITTQISILTPYENLSLTEYPTDVNANPATLGETSTLATTQQEFKPLPSTSNESGLRFSTENENGLLERISDAESFGYSIPKIPSACSNPSANAGMFQRESVSNVMTTHSLGDCSEERHGTHHDYQNTKPVVQEPGMSPASTEEKRANTAGNCKISDESDNFAISFEDTGVKNGTDDDSYLRPLQLPKRKPYLMFEV